MKKNEVIAKIKEIKKLNNYDISEMEMEIIANCEEIIERAEEKAS